jgi:hypothetical protein
MMTFLLWAVVLSGLAVCLIAFGILKIMGFLWEVSEQDDRPWTDDYTRWAMPLPQEEPNHGEPDHSVEDTAEIILSYELKPGQELQENSLP